LLIGCAKPDKNCPYAVTKQTRGVVSTVFLNASNMPVEYDQCLIDATNVWNAHLTEKKVSFALGKSPYEIKWYFDNVLRPEENMRATIFSDDGVIWGGYISVNDFNHDFSTGYPTYSQVDCESVFIHEIGHILGIGHIDDPESVMYPYLGTGTVKRELKEKELESLHCLYN
jgi:hypothetical protein